MNWLGWHESIYLGLGNPYDHDMIRIRRPDKPVEVVDPRALPPYFNVANLEWQPWDGETLEAMTERVALPRSPYP